MSGMRLSARLCALAGAGSGSADQDTEMHDAVAAAPMGAEGEEEPMIGPQQPPEAAGAEAAAAAAADADSSDADEYAEESEDNDDEDDQDDDNDDDDDDLSEDWEEEEQEAAGDEEEEEDEPAFMRHHVLRLLFGGGGRGRRVPPDLQKLPVPIVPLPGDLAAQLNAAASARDVGQWNPIWACLDSSFDSSQAPLVTTERLRQLLHEEQLRAALQRQHLQQQQQQQQQQDPAPKRLCSTFSRRNRSSEDGGDGGGSSSRAGGLEGLIQSAAASITGRGSASASTRRADQSGSAAAAAEAAGSSSAAAAAGPSCGRAGSSSSSEFDTKFDLINSAQLLMKRELSLGRQQGFSRRQQRHLCCHRALPLHPSKVRDSMHSRAYIGQYSASGDFYIAAFQDRRVRLYDTQRNWQLRKDVTTRMTRWTITDTTLSPDQRLLVYASISPVAFVVNVGSSGDPVESLANITELHEPLALDGSMAPGAGNTRAAFEGDEEYDSWRGRDFGIWSIAWSPQGGQLIAGTNDNSVYVYDIESKHCLARLTGHGNDVNAVAYLQGDGSDASGAAAASPHLLLSGSDDHMVRLWDTRVRDRAGRNSRQPQGVLVGHTEGITHLCPKGDGHHLISNSKDQTVKLWDVRKALSQSAAIEQARQRPQIPHWDYRWEEYPATGYNVVHPGDVSLMTYRGHAVLQTLIRAYFSPAHTTGQRYIYAGSAEGVINAWDVVSGKPVAQFEYHRALVRDCSWHPYEPEMTSVSWDGRVVSWAVSPPHGKPLAGDRGDVGRYY